MTRDEIIAEITEILTKSRRGEQRANHKYDYRTGSYPNYKYWYRLKNGHYVSSDSPDGAPHVDHSQQVGDGGHLRSTKPEDNYSGGGFKIEKAKNLSSQEQIVEAKFAKQILADVPGAVSDYEKKFGKVVDTDDARELSKDYSKSKATRALLSAAVHEPASFLVKKVFEKKLAEKADPNGQDYVSFTGGGTGSGKSTAIQNVGGEAQKELEGSHFVYDTNLNDFGKAKAKIDQVLKTNRQVHIVAVYRDPVDAFKGAIHRAKRVGRTVPYKTHVENHVGVAKAIPELYAEYADNPKVHFDFIDNTGAAGSTKYGDVSLFEDAEHDQKKLERKIRKLLDSEYENDNIDRTTYLGFLGH